MAHPNEPFERRELRDPVTGIRIEQLTTAPAHHWHLAAPDTPLTPRGDYLLFLSDRVVGAAPRLFRRGMRTGTIEPVTESDRLVPDGITPAANGRQAIALLQGEEGEVVAIDLETGEWETLAVFLDARLEGCHRSASGEYVVTVVTREEEAAITAVHTEGMRTMPILEGSGDIHAARFSPDSKNSVVYVPTDSAAIHCVEFDGANDRALWEGDRDRAVGCRLSAISSPKSNAVSLTADSRQPTALHRDTRVPIWLGSGDEVLFIAGVGPGPILAVPRQGGIPRVVCPLPCVWVRSAGNGERLVALVEGGSVAEPPSYEIMLIESHSGVVQPLCSHGSASARPCFSPDGRAVVYSGVDDRGFSQLYLAFLDEN